MRILITGALGQLGVALQESLSSHELALVDLPEVDITHRQAFFEVMSGADPQLVIHCAALTNVDLCAKEPELAYRVNGLGTQNVALACQNRDIPMLHVSTNEVFDGQRRSGYEEWMPLNPANPYGRSKAAAETYVKDLLSRFYIVRTAWLFAPGGHNFIHAILDRARANGELRVVVDEIGNPTYATDLARAIADLIESQQYGVYHFTNAGSCSRWEFANQILSLAGLANVANHPILGKDFRRASTPPVHGVLHNVAGAAIGLELRPWKEALAEYIEMHVLVS
jgi:dTDP-4-dehydrorhamnose reductase